MTLAPGANGTTSCVWADMRLEDTGLQMMGRQHVCACARRALVLGVYLCSNMLGN